MSWSSRTLGRDMKGIRKICFSQCIFCHLHVCWDINILLKIVMFIAITYTQPVTQWRAARQWRLIFMVTSYGHGLNLLLRWTMWVWADGVFCHFVVIYGYTLRSISVFAAPASKNNSITFVFFVQNDKMYRGLFQNDNPGFSQIFYGIKENSSYHCP